MTSYIVVIFKHGREWTRYFSKARVMETIRSAHSFYPNAHEVHVYPEHGRLA